MSDTAPITCSRRTLDEFLGATFGRFRRSVRIAGLEVDDELWDASNDDPTIALTWTASGFEYTDHSHRFDELDETHRSTLAELLALDPMETFELYLDNRAPKRILVSVPADRTDMLRRWLADNGGNFVGVDPEA